MGGDNAAAADRNCFARLAEKGHTSAGLVYAEKRTDGYLAITTSFGGASRRPDTNRSILSSWMSSLHKGWPTAP